MRYQDTVDLIALSFAKGKWTLALQRISANQVPHVKDDEEISLPCPKDKKLTVQVCLQP